jgi:cobalt-zinc-cadmium efflux system outer membrane protein
MTEGPIARRRALWTVAALAVLTATATIAAPAPPYAELLRAAEGSAPRLVESEANVRAAQGQAEQAAARPNPTLDFLAENIGTRNNGLAEQQNTLTLSQPLELGGKRGARVAAGNAEVGAAQARASLARADFAYDLALAYAAAEAAQKRLAILTDDLGRAREDLRAAKALVEAGKEAELRGIQAEAAATGAEADLETARAEASEALARLSGLVGAPQAFTEIGPSLLNVATGLAKPSGAPAPIPPALMVARAERDAAARRVSVERTRAVPDLTVSVGARTFAGRDDTALVAGVSAPLPLFDRNRGAVHAANAQLAASEARFRAARLDAEAAWRTAAAQASAGETRLRAAAQAEAAAREGYRLAHVGYEGGKTSLLELSSARHALVEAEGRLLDAQLARVRAEAQLARLAGRIPFGA